MIWLALGLIVIVAVLVRQILRDGDCAMCGHLIYLHDADFGCEAALRGTGLVCRCDGHEERHGRDR